MLKGRTRGNSINGEAFQQIRGITPWQRRISRVAVLPLPAFDQGRVARAGPENILPPTDNPDCLVRGVVKAARLVVILSRLGTQTGELLAKRLSGNRHC